MGEPVLQRYHIIVSNMEENNTTVETKSLENNIPEINKAEENIVNVKDVNNDTDKCSDITSNDINHANDSGDNNTPVKTTPEEHLERLDTEKYQDIDASSLLEIPLPRMRIPIHLRYARSAVCKLPTPKDAVVVVRYAMI